ncbi:carboxypeptidase-like regulatory domain-containing protein [Niastella sp. OAS944]|uniref:carboxypeptidase-like regulatory domain-containing protein n=1 Tax=Niastella sp. OAS944 TaxID=2664089 RepID=UPI0034806759|nr:hypothetical protein [Chitinophagaceae bacterium OAS944]
MKQIKVVVIFFLLVFSALFLKAQVKGIVLTGKVVTFEERSPIEGATIQVKGTRNVSGTMYDGMYAIEIKPGDSVLVFSFDGYETKELPIVEEKREYNVMLKVCRGERPFGGTLTLNNYCKTICRYEIMSYISLVI